MNKKKYTQKDLDRDTKKTILLFTGTRELWVNKDDIKFRKLLEEEMESYNKRNKK